MSTLLNCFAVLVIIGICTFPNNVNARYYKRVYEDQSQDISQIQQRPQLQTKPLFIDTQDEQKPQVQTKPFHFEGQSQQRPQLQTKPLFIDTQQQNQQRPQLQTKPFNFDGQTQQQNQRPGEQNPRPQQKPEQGGQLSQSQQRPQIGQFSQETDDWSDEDQNELQQNLIPQIGNLDSNQQTQFIQDIDKYAQELDNQSQQSGHKGQVTKEDVDVVEEKNERKPWYIRLKNWGNKKLKDISG